MSVFGVSMMKDEADVAFDVVMHMAEEGCAGLIIADNLSTDGTRERLEEAKREIAGALLVEIVSDDDPAYYQSRKMTDLAHRAAGKGASWIVPFDADEVWYAPHSLNKWLTDMPASVGVAKAELYNHFATAVDPDAETAFERMVYRQRDPGVLPKVAFRYTPDAVILQGNHAVTGADRDDIGGGLAIRHFPYRSFDQFLRKAHNGAEAYKATDMPESEGAHWRQYGALLDRGGPTALRDVWEKWFYFDVPALAGMLQDPAPFRRWR